MADNNTQYSYLITASYVNGKEEVVINPDTIKTCVINYRYQSANTPIFTMKVNLDAQLYNKMQDNRTTAKLVVTISKKSVTAETAVRYIRKQFSYHFPTLKYSDIDKDLDGSKSVNEKGSYVNCVIGLVDDSMMNANKMVINNIFKNTNNISIIHNYTSNMRMIIEPFDYLDTIDCCIIPPMEGVTQLLSYLNTIHSFYSTNYKFFMDYNYTYLLSDKGNSIDIRDGSFTSIKITVDKEIDKRGIECDYKQRIYLIQVKEDEIAYNKKDITEKLYNKLYGVDQNGIKHTEDIANITKAYDSKDRFKMIRLPEGNTHYLENMINSIETGEFPLNVMVADMDNSIFVPYKQFIINYFRERRDYNGVYLLTSKQEVYVNQGQGEFYSTLLLGLKKKY